MRFPFKGRKSYIVLAIIVVSVVMVVVGVRYFRGPVEPEYSIRIDIDGHEYMEFGPLSIGEVLHGKLVVDTGHVVFYLVDSWNNRIHDTVVEAGNSYSFSIKVKQSGERYRLYFVSRTDQEHLPKSAKFYTNFTPTRP